MLLSSPATSSCAIAFSSASLRLEGEVLEDRRSVLPREHAEDHDLIFQTQRRQERRNVAGVPVAQHVAQPRVVAGTKHRSQFLGGPCHVSDCGEGLVTFGAGELLFHLRERCSDDIVMMQVWPDGLDRVEPQPVNQIQVA